MAIDIRIKQPFFSNKTMPLDVILGDRLAFGNYINDRLQIGVRGETEILVYDPACIGRGFSVIWHPAERKQIDLRLPVPSTTAEVTTLFATAERMARHWLSHPILDGVTLDLAAFRDALQNEITFNERTLKRMSSQILDGTYPELVLHSVAAPLTIAGAEASEFLKGESVYAAWLHCQQAPLLSHT